MKYGFVKVASAIPQVRVADCQFNVRKMQEMVSAASSRGVEVICFPELSITAYTCQDLFQQNLLLEEAEKAMVQLLDFTSTYDIICIVGAPVAYGGALLNAAVVMQRGKILGVVPKSYLPNYK